MKREYFGISFVLLGTGLYLNSYLPLNIGTVSYAPHSICTQGLSSKLASIGLPFKVTYYVVGSIISK